MSSATIGASGTLDDADITAFASGVRGDTVYRGATGFTKLNKGAVGQFLNQGANDPAWSDCASDAIHRGFEIDDVANDDLVIVVKAGVLHHGSKAITKTANVTLTLGTAADWWDGAADTYAGGAGWCYVGVDVSGNVKLLGANAPDKADVSGNTAGTLLYWYDSTLYWRVIGAVRIDTDDKAHAMGHIQNGNMVMFDVPPNVTTTVSENTWSGALSCLIPAISNMGMFGMMLGDNDTSDSWMFIRPNGSTWSTDDENGIGQSSTAGGAHDIGGQRLCATDSSQQIQLYNKDTGASDSTSVDVEGYFLNIR